jgi:hypothetical protein
MDKRITIEERCGTELQVRTEPSEAVILYLAGSQDLDPSALELE